MSRRRPGDPSRVGSMLFALGCLSVLSVAFLAGVTTGRHWPRWLPSLGSSATARAEREAPARKTGEGRLGEKRPAEPTPMLTYYQELTAPLTAPPPPPKPKGPEKPGPAKVKAPATASGDDSDARTATAPPAAPRLSGGPRYAVQIGAFKERGQAEAMRASLASAGWDAYLAEVEGPDVVRYRVRVGSYASREEARVAAQRLGSERRLSTYVTAR